MPCAEPMRVRQCVCARIARAQHESVAYTHDLAFEDDSDAHLVFRVGPVFRASLANADYFERGYLCVCKFRGWDAYAWQAALATLTRALSECALKQTQGHLGETWDTMSTMLSPSAQDMLMASAVSVTLRVCEQTDSALNLLHT
jgi:hypothetical protein